MTELIYTGVGTQATPENICKVFTYLGAELGSRMIRLRSGHADGSDLAFEAGSPLVLGDGFDRRLGREIYLPWKNFNGRRKYFDPYIERVQDDEGYYIPDEHWSTYQKAIEIAKSVIPWWDKLKPSHQRLHTRNVYQVLGLDLTRPSEFLVCYAEKDNRGEPKGGTRTAIKIAEKYNVPVFNRFDYEDDDSFIEAVLKHVQTLTLPKQAKAASDDARPDHDPKSQEPDASSLDAPVAPERGAVVGETKDSADAGTGDADGGGSGQPDPTPETAV